jgi:serine/threonine protein kinase
MIEGDLNYVCGPAAGDWGPIYLGLLHSTTAVALKCVASPTPDQQERFEREILILKACRHPNLALVLGACILPDRTVLAMEAMPGGDLRKKLRQDEAGHYMWYQRWAIQFSGRLILPRLSKLGIKVMLPGVRGG